MELNETELCKLAYKYGTDKCPQLKHAYTPVYYEMFKDKRESIKKVLEMGIGYYKSMEHVPIVYDRELKRFYPKGASLKMWRDFFPNAQIFGADIRPETIFEDTRIKTYLCDETKKEDLTKLIENTGPDIDLVVDDASHHVDDQIFASRTLLPLLKKDIIYIIEDVTHSKVIRQALGEGYDYYLPPIPRKWHGGMILVIRNKQGLILANARIKQSLRSFQDLKHHEIK